MLITVGWATTLYRWRQKWQRQQQAWHWWHQQQALHSHHTAESIRDGLLQQTFAFRRYLETLEEDGPTSSSPEQTARWLERFQTFYKSLEILSDELSPPFIAESLPLALKFTLSNWSFSPPYSESDTSRPSPILHFDLPAEWPHSSAHQNQIVLSIVTALLALLMPECQNVKQINIDLHHTETDNILTLTIENKPGQLTSKITKLAELQHLKEIFHSLAAGRLEISQAGTATTGCLSWQNSSHL